MYGEGKLQFTPFCVVPSWAAQTDFVEDIWKAITFFVLGPILVKFHIRTRLIESFPTIFRTWFCAEVKLHFTPVYTLRQLRRDEALFPPFYEGRRVSSEVPADTCTRVLGVGKIWRPCDLRSRSYKRLYTHGHTYSNTHARRLIA